MLVNLTVAYFRIENQWNSIVVGHCNAVHGGSMMDTKLLPTFPVRRNGWRRLGVSRVVTFWKRPLWVGSTIALTFAVNDGCIMLHFHTFPNHAPSFSRSSRCLCLCSSSYVWYLILHTHGIYLDPAKIDADAGHGYSPSFSNHVHWLIPVVFHFLWGQLVAQPHLRSCPWNQSQTCLMNDESPFLLTLGVAWSRSCWQNLQFGHKSTELDKPPSQSTHSATISIISSVPLRLWVTSWRMKSWRWPPSALPCGRWTVAVRDFALAAAWYNFLECFWWVE